MGWLEIAGAVLKLITMFFGYLGERDSVKRKLKEDALKEGKEAVKTNDQNAMRRAINRFNSI